MNSDNLVSKEDFYRLFKKENFSIEELHELVTIEFGLEWPKELSEDSEIDEIVEYVYMKYYEAMEGYKLAKKALTLHTPNKQTQDGGPTRKSWIENFVLSQKQLKYKELVDITSVELGYAEKGKSARTRVKKVLQELVMKKKVSWNKDTGEINIL